MRTFVGFPGPFIATISGVHISCGEKKIAERFRLLKHNCSLEFQFKRSSHHFNSKLAFSVITLKNWKKHSSSVDKQIIIVGEAKNKRQHLKVSSAVRDEKRVGLDFSYKDV